MARKRQKGLKRSMLLIIVMVCAFSALTFSTATTVAAADTTVKVIQISTKEKKSKIKEARKLYTAALDKANSEYKATAKEALGIDKETTAKAKSKGEKTAAKKHYQQALSDASVKKEAAKKEARKIYQDAIK
jgi:uncharacterized membrane protein